jgi:hypothetical protein
MQVLFLALGATRRRTVTDESAQVVADSGRAIVVIDQASAWSRDSFAPDVEVVELCRLELLHSPMSIERSLLFEAPRLLFRMIDRGPLARSARRAAKAYERRIADPLHRRMFMPLYRRVWRRARHRLIERHVLHGVSFDLFVVSDPVSMPVAARLFMKYAAKNRIAPRISYGLDYAAPAASAGGF